MELLFSVSTPLGVDVRTTAEYWGYIVTIKHPVMQGKEDVVKSVLEFPDEIRVSKTDKDIFLYYKSLERLYCVVVKHTADSGFVITTYPADKKKEGETVWTR
ncbi:hypothetical protein [Candidatus Magnetominusculus xianensis]|uniref:DUF4258 domain-containing protein n=1 Tax=Candidatus Magnetominusculus xianensis TaxID=1748249 RepID=A0ABR5SIC3_9BACT|nr:hypothetical protein [Candidatus Magnetominusculus xianensis]KWT92168.1 hypothetical protein ASN18_0572 [Candidatus Magnetominusculus xianensis]MBF0404661.1 DUF4258 domain-containing protein [Nitrospirota bacterium]